MLVHRARVQREDITDMTLRNQKGAILILTYIVFFVLLTLAASFASTNFSELFFSKRYNFTAAAFWLAEAGISRFLINPSMLDEDNHIQFSFKEGTVRLSKDDSDASKRVITATGTVKGVQKSIQIEFAALPPEIYNNVLSVKGDIIIDGKKTALNILDRTRLSGHLKNSGSYTNILWEDKKEGFNPLRLQIVYPDTNGNGVTDEFNDFVGYYQRLLSDYSRDDIVYIQGNGTYTLTPDQTLQNKKIIFVQGSEGTGDVLIQFNGTWKDNQNLTVISTGTVTFNQGGVIPQDSQLNIIAWSGYHETAIFPSHHRGLIYTHGQARFDNILDTSVTSGCVIVQGGIFFGDIWSTKIFEYADVLHGGALPPGFQGLVTERASGYSSTPRSWREI